MPAKNKNIPLQQGNSQNSTITVQQGLVVPANRQQDAITISRKEFIFLRDKVEKISCKANTFSNIGFAAVGIIGSAIFALIPFIKEKDKFLITISIFVIIVSIITSVISFKLSKKSEQTDYEIKSDTIKHMKLVEDRFFDINI